MMRGQALVQRVLSAMESVGQQEEMKACWGDQFDDLVKYLAIATAPTEVGLEALRLELTRRQQRKTLVLSGERCSGAKSDGSDSPILLGLAKVAEIIAPVSSLESKGRTGREPNALTIALSGGVKLTPEMGEIPCSIMAEQFNALTKNRYAACVQHDDLSLNTGDQGRVLSAIAFSRRFDLIVIAHVLDHSARFGATVIEALQQLVENENTKLQSYGRLTNTDVTKHLRKMPDILFVSFGDWKDLDPRRGKGEGISRAREAFGPLQTADEAIFPGKHLGNEYLSRYQSEQEPVKSLGFACPATPPLKMLERHIPGWVREFYQV